MDSDAQRRFRSVGAGASAKVTKLDAGQLPMRRPVPAYRTDDASKVHRPGRAEGHSGVTPPALSDRVRNSAICQRNTLPVGW